MRNLLPLLQIFQLTPEPEPGKNRFIPAEEMLFGKSWVPLASWMISFLPLSLVIYYQKWQGPLLASFIFAFGSMATLPRFLRFILCRKWPASQATILKRKGLADYSAHGSGVRCEWMGLYGRTGMEIEVTYEIDGQNFEASFLPLSDEDAVKKNIQIYYNPTNPSRFSQKKNLEGGFFFITISILFLIYFSWHGL